jgi:hypothetical protein
MTIFHIQTLDLYGCLNEKEIKPLVRCSGDQEGDLVLSEDIIRPGKLGNLLS